MILLNDPWSVYERTSSSQRRRLALLRAALCLLYCAACLLAGLTLGIIIAHR